MAEALYRKYRPVTFKDVVGQEHIERTLRNAIEQDKVSHAYLFCGPRGTGKTTTARILAKALLCEKGPTIDPDGACPECLAIASGTHPDVYELDAASRTGVENVREEIISRVNYAPTRGAYKVYIIDEVHMLSSAAFNALLKTLEEPPEHVVFILCTTDPQKVPETIQSRCQRFDFHRISVESIVSRLGAICMAEGVAFDGEALDLIAHRADGGMRNALTTLEQLIAFGEGSVTLESAQNFLGALDDNDLAEIVNAIGAHDAAACFTWVAHYVETGSDLAQFVHDLSEYMRNLYLMSMAGADVEIAVSDSTRAAMTKELAYYGQDRLNRILIILGDVMKDMRTSSNPRLTFEIALARMVRPDSDITIDSLAERVEALEQLVKAMRDSQPSAVPSAVRKESSAAHQMPVADRHEDVQEHHVGLERQASSPAVQPKSAYQQNPAAKPLPVEQQSNIATEEQTASTRTVASEQQSSASVVPSTDVGEQASTSSIPSTLNLDNPAAVQRLWHSATTALRKANPARGVLFMNAKVSSDIQQPGLLIEFSADNSFAYTAAQKKEVQQLLAQTLEQVAGGRVPYRLTIAEGGKRGAAAPRTTGTTFAPRSNPVRREPSVASQPPVVNQTKASTPKPSASSQAKVSAPLNHQGASTSIDPQPTFSEPVEKKEPVPVYDQVPLDVYDSYTPSVSSSLYEQSYAGTSQSANISSEVQHSEMSQAVDVSSDGQDEEKRIKEMLINSFGEGIKFEEMD